MQLTWTVARHTIIETTEIGYTVASQDRLWTVFIFDVWSEDEYRHNRLFTQGIGEPWSYEMWDKELVWTSRREAEVFADQMRAYLAAHNQTDEDPPPVYVMNWGDDARYEARLIGRDSGATCRIEPKFVGSRAAWDAMAIQGPLWQRHEASLASKARAEREETEG
jgi:hypothetical protein